VLTIQSMAGKVSILLRGYKNEFKIMAQTTAIPSITDCDDGAHNIDYVPLLLIALLAPL